MDEGDHDSEVAKDTADRKDDLPDLVFDFAEQEPLPIRLPPSSSSNSLAGLGAANVEEVNIMVCYLTVFNLIVFSLIVFNLIVFN